MVQRWDLHAAWPRVVQHYTQASPSRQPTQPPSRAFMKGCWVSAQLWQPFVGGPATFLERWAPCAFECHSSRQPAGGHCYNSSPEKKGGENHEDEVCELDANVKFDLVRSVGEECQTGKELRNLLEKKPNYDGFETVRPHAHRARRVQDDQCEQVHQGRIRHRAPAMPRTQSSILRWSVLSVAALAAIHWLQPAPAFTQGPARRDALLISAGLLAAGASQAVSAAVDPCKDGANNCWSTAGKGNNLMSPWKWPAGTDKGAAVAALKETLLAYPKEGQDGVDLGGWTVAEDKLSSDGYARIEFMSGLGNFAKFFNGNKPFVDDFEVSVGDDSVSVRSSSRVGDSDLGVNAKRINYIAAKLRAQGWDAPGVKA